MDDSLLCKCAGLIEKVQKHFVQDARKVFDKMPQRDNITWSSMVNCYTQNGYYEESLQMSKDMYVQGFAVKPELIVSVLSACVWTRDFGVGRDIHALVVVNGWMEESVFLSTALVDLYLRCHESLMVFQVFERMEVKNELSWTAMISGCAACQNYGIALDCFRAMQVEGIKPSRVTLVAILPLCIELGCLRHGKEIHAFAFRPGLNYEIHMSSALIHMPHHPHVEGQDGDARRRQARRDGFARSIGDISCILVEANDLGNLPHITNNTKFAIIPNKLGK
ncbi:pentatricopeptide repeat-containing protein At4g31070, mitochondrial-like [Actinidia eriantha]|uniref:pentatricopeptide repeat-containing protein At4g31070, mitochondrial-like n=1 Tax=Actinidia eriantha TaxID=165200 RepID=UPI0025828D90|nr:pentatricopeptide repeat-containing protein At4g31070, mitochondrial-like [Actinidia eriantha]